ncbi:hypothetical protein B0T24DRAFT_616635 [Lasiosphaeria ovina]|uniref:Uncharacterized protein n=1 Tax=Lasiosphaeria ovina TaxID=92902 RepID=A0AAE0KGM0_9PEZI|nr:hypothetical protein B0T24DRAFT_616635 [Lasiosphaeria ovina]
MALAFLCLFGFSWGSSPQPWPRSPKCNKFSRRERRRPPIYRPSWQGTIQYKAGNILAIYTAYIGEVASFHDCSGGQTSKMRCGVLLAAGRPAKRLNFMCGYGRE